jgi:hypothetical protein
MASSGLILPEYGKCRTQFWIDASVVSCCSEHCNGALGMEAGSITDHELTSSSTHDASSVGPQMGR